MASLQNPPSKTLFLDSFPQLQKHGTLPCYRRSGISFLIRAEQAATSSMGSPSQDRPRRRQVLAIGTVAPWLFLVNPNSKSFAAESRKGFLPVVDNKDGYQFLYPFGWQEVVIEGQDKVFKDVTEPLENVSVNLFPTSKQDIRDFGPPQEVAETLIKKGPGPSFPKDKATRGSRGLTPSIRLVNRSMHDVDGKAYYTFEFIAKAPNYTRHALSTISIANGTFYTLTTGANERRWEKMEDILHEIIDSFKISNV